MFFKERRSPISGVRLLPLLPLRELVVFPHAAVPFMVGRTRSVTALTEANGSVAKEIFLVAQREALASEPGVADVHTMGTIATVVQVIRLPDGKLKVLVDGQRRGRMVRFLDEEDCIRAEVEEVVEQTASGPEVEPSLRAARAAFEEYARLQRSIPTDTALQFANVDEAGKLADLLVRHLPLRTDVAQAVLETNDPVERLGRVQALLLEEIALAQVERRTRTRLTKGSVTEAKGNPEPERDEFKQELQELEQKINEKALPPEAAERVQRELRKLKMMNPMSAEAAVIRNYLDHILALPWAHCSEDRLDVTLAKEILNRDHAGLQKVKTRVLEFLSVLSLVERLDGPVLCLVGPPGVGKTSLAKSIAEATHRQFVRVALGGVRDEAEIRGHRRTYIGALPGKIIHGIRKAGTSNPVFLLDEVDKMNADFRGDPSSALLEVLDPEQNKGFNDHYLDLDYDLSKVLFICTANTLEGIPVPLQDRLEIVRLSGYTEPEKLAIARRHLLPKQIKAHGLQPGQLQLTPDALQRLAREYTREAGVRGLERELASVCRKVARRVVVKGPETKVRVDAARVEKMLGPPRHRAGKVHETDQIGFVNGLAWTQAGGVMVPVEVLALPGSGKITMTGSLGTVFRESCEAAIAWMRSRADQLGLEKDFWQHVDVHVHVPELWGVDGPSAGITLSTAIVSAICRIPVRRDVAMTGEITLRGFVKPIGGLKEKLLAAQAAGVTRALIPVDNEKDLRDVPRGLRETMDLHLVSTMDEVLTLSLAVERRDEIFRGDPRGLPS
ncbi:MAG: endopeptidase La [Myxococcales bacterium]|nr:endopeptidase La [Myxococcales bacterium]